MRHIKTPENLPQNFLFDDFEGTHWIHTLLDPSAVRCLTEGWQGVFRRSVLKLMPANQIGEAFSPDQGRPTKEIYSMVGLLLIMEFKAWTAEEAAQAYFLDAGVQFALNLPRDRQYVSTRSVEEYRRLLREGDDHCAEIFGKVTKALIDELNLNIEKQRLDSTHLFSNMAKLGRTQLMGTTIKRFLTQLLRHDKAAHQALPADLLQRYAATEGRLFGYGKASDEEYAKRIQQLAEDLYFLVERFAAEPGINQRTSYKALERVLRDHCEIHEAKGCGKSKSKQAIVTVKAKATDRDGQSSGVMQNPSDPDAGYDGHKGPGYQVQLAQSYGEENEVNLIVGCLPQSAAQSDSDSLIALIESQAEYELNPTKTLADTAYGSDANVEACLEAGIELISPVPGGKKTSEAKQPQREDALAEAEKSSPQASQMAGEAEAGKEETKAQRIAARREAEKTKAWKEEYAKRSGIEGVNSALKRVTGLKRLAVRGAKSVTLAVYLKTTGWNILRAAFCYAQRGCKARKLAVAGG
jgi:hypothetical protein